MKKSTITVIILIVVLIGVIIFFLFAKHPGTSGGLTGSNGGSTANQGNGSSETTLPITTPPTTPATTTPLSTPQGNQFAIQTPNGQVLVNNFYQNPTSSTQVYDSNVLIISNSDYQLDYIRDDSEFIISLFAYSTDQARTQRTEAESAFLTTLGITQSDACKLNVSLGVPISYDADLAGPNYGLSFCPSGVSF